MTIWLIIDAVIRMLIGWLCVEVAEWFTDPAMNCWRIGQMIKASDVHW